MPTSIDPLTTLGRYLLFIATIFLFMFAIDIIVLVLMWYIYNLGFLAAIISLLVGSGIVLVGLGAAFLLGIDWILSLCPSIRVTKILVPIFSVINLLLILFLLINTSVRLKSFSFYPILCAIAYSLLTYGYMKAAREKNQ
ncbi:hypothetical protein CLV58_12563 [Spirosoma oryzae]|uniref:Uncharacterized protein n=1 Tax=Spirosoma oryzae TaxID=1469603 RepID=A0A2T0S8T9_9BACT|nr:hypothetical protein CLV58_12563 [Spirosoma oryzae]